MSGDEVIPRNPVRAEEVAYAERAQAHARQIADRLSEMLPDGMRFEWTDGE